MKPTKCVLSIYVKVDLSSSRCKLSVVKLYMCNLVVFDVFPFISFHQCLKHLFERVTEKEIIIHSLTDLLCKWFQQLGQSQESLTVPHVGGRSPDIWTSFCCFPRHICREQDWSGAAGTETSSDERGYHYRRQLNSLHNSTSIFCTAPKHHILWLTEHSFVNIHYALDDPIMQYG